MSGNAENVDHHRHPDVARTAPQKPAEKPTDEGDNNNDPERDCFHSGGRERDHWPERDAVDHSR